MPRIRARHFHALLSAITRRRLLATSPRFLLVCVVSKSLRASFEIPEIPFDSARPGLVTDQQWSCFELPCQGHV